MSELFLAESCNSRDKIRTTSCTWSTKTECDYLSLSVYCVTLHLSLSRDHFTGSLSRLCYTTSLSLSLSLDCYTGSLSRLCYTGSLDCYTRAVYCYTRSLSVWIVLYWISLFLDCVVLDFWIVILNLSLYLTLYVSVCMSVHECVHMPIISVCSMYHYCTI